MTKTRTDRKPPLPRSPIRVRSRRVLRPSISNTTAQSEPGSLMKTKSMDLETVPDYDTISFDLLEIAKMAQRQQGENGMSDSGNFALPLFERGRFYDEYSARRNERLMRKQISEADEEKMRARDIGVNLESEKKRDLKKFNDKSCLIPRTPLTERRENINPNPRYMLRSMSKEMKKPASLLPVGSTSSVGGERKTVGRRVRKI